MKSTITEVMIHKLDMNVEDDIDFSFAPAPKKKNNLKKQQKYKEGRGSKTKWPYHPRNQ